MSHITLKNKSKIIHHSYPSDIPFAPHGKTGRKHTYVHTGQNLPKNDTLSCDFKSEITTAAAAAALNTNNTVKTAGAYIKNKYNH